MSDEEGSGKFEPPLPRAALVPIPSVLEPVQLGSEVSQRRLKPDVLEEASSVGTMSDEAPVRVFSMSELTPPTEQCGTGSLLMTGEGRDRMPSGAPYQPAFWFGDQSIILGLVNDDEGHHLRRRGGPTSALGGH